MFSFLARWRPIHVFAMWCLYWLGLAAIVLGPGIAAGIVATQGADNTSNISVAVGTAGLTLGVTQGEATTWALTASIPALALWIAGPPLLMWFVWFANARRETREARRAELGAAPARDVPPVKTPDNVRARRD